MIDRPDFLDLLWKWKDHDLIKVVTGVRRCGKSTVLDAFADRLAASGVPSSCILRMDFESEAFDSIRTVDEARKWLAAHRLSKVLAVWAAEGGLGLPLRGRAVPMRSAGGTALSRGRPGMAASVHGGRTSARRLRPVQASACLCNQGSYVQANAAPCRTCRLRVEREWPTGP